MRTPIGTLREELQAQCLPPGVSQPAQREREIDLQTPTGSIQHQQ